MTNDAAASGAPRFDVVLRGYDRKQVDEHVARMQRVIGRMRADLEVARSQPLPVVLPAAQRPQPAPRARPGEMPDVVGSFTDRMQSILQAAEEEAVEIRKKAHLAAHHETQAARAEIGELSRQRDVLVGELNRMRGQLESLLAAPTTQMPAHRPSPVRRPGPGPATGGQPVARPFIDPQSLTVPSVPSASGPSAPAPSIPGSADLTQPAVKPPAQKQPAQKQPAGRSDEAVTVVSAIPRPNDGPVDAPTVVRQPVGKQPVGKQSVGTSPVDRQPAGAPPVDRQSVDRQSFDRQSVDRQPADKEPVDLAKPAATAVVAAQPGGPVKPEAAAPADGGTTNGASAKDVTTATAAPPAAADGDKAATAEPFRPVPRGSEASATDAEVTVKVSAVRAAVPVKTTPGGSAGSAGPPQRPSPKPKPRPSSSPTAATPIVKDDVRDQASAPSRSG